MSAIRSIIVLSGDRHEFAAVALRNTVLEVSTSPLHQVLIFIQAGSSKLNIFIVLLATPYAVSESWVRSHRRRCSYEMYDSDTLK